MSRITDDILIIAPDPRGLGGKAGVVVADEVQAINILVDNIDDNGAGFTNIADPRLNTTIGGTTYGAVSGFASLDATGKIPIGQIPAAALTGIQPKNDARVITVAALPTYVAAGAGVGKTLTSSVFGALPAIDGVSLLVSDRIVIDSNGSASDVDNGIYTVTNLGSGVSNWVLTRAIDMDTDAEVVAATVFVSDGASGGAKSYIASTPTFNTIDVDPFTWAVFSTNLLGTTSTNNTSLGLDAMNSITSGTQNVLLGVNAGFSLSSGSNNTVTGHQALEDLSTGSRNVVYGFQAMQNTTIGVIETTAIGYQTLRILTSGTHNTAIGYQSQNATANGSNNTSTGYQALLLNSSGSDNCAYGNLSCDANIGGNNNSAFGSNSLTSCTSGSNNTALGYNASSSLLTATNTTAIGYRALNANTANNSTAVGADALLLATGLNNVAMGYQAGNLITSGSGNTILGNDADVSINSAIDRISIGRAAICTSNGSAQIGEASVFGSSTLQFRTQIIANESWIGGGTTSASIDNSGNIIRGGVVLTGTDTANNTGIGSGHFASLTSGLRNAAFGVNTLNLLTTGSNNSAFGYNALSNNTSSSNTAIGYLSLTLNTTGTNNTALGAFALDANLTGGNNTAVGWASLSECTSNSNSALGYGSLSTLTTGSNNSSLGYFSLNGLISGDNNVGIGYQAGLTITTGSNNTCIGNSSNTNSAASIERTSLGYSASCNANYSVQLGQNVVNGAGTLVFRTQTIATETWIGGGTTLAQIDNSGNLIRGGSLSFTDTANNTGVGTGHFAALTLGIGNTAFGVNTLNANTTGSNNIAIGYEALTDNIGGDNNMAIGYHALYLNTSGTNNIAIGNSALDANISANHNTAVGFAALTLATTSFNCAFGNYALASLTTGFQCLGVGYLSLNSCDTGFYNTGIGFRAGDTITNGTHNTCIGHDADVDAVTSIERIAIGASAICTTNGGVQLGQNTVIGAGLLNFRTQTIASEAWIGGGTSLAQIDNSGNIGRSTSISISDTNFTLFDNVDNTKQLQINVSNVPTSTTFIPGIQYTSGSSKIAVADDVVSGSVGFATNPWSTPQTSAYVIQRIGNIVCLRMNGVISTIGTPNSAITNNFIPSGWEPPGNVSISIAGRNASVNTAAITARARPLGSVIFTVDNGTSFGGAAATAGFETFAMFWMV